jgi:hypothetical protein
MDSVATNAMDKHLGDYSPLFIPSLPRCGVLDVELIVPVLNQSRVLIKNFWKLAAAQCVLLGT